MATAEGIYPKVGGDPPFASEYNDFHNPIKQVYTGAGFDSSATNTTVEGSFELDAVTLTNDRNYVKVRITGFATADTDSGGSAAQVRLKAQIKEIGGSYADIVPYTVTLRLTARGATLSDTIRTNILIFG